MNKEKVMMKIHTGVSINFLKELLQKEDNTKSHLISTDGNFLDSPSTMKYLETKEKDGLDTLVMGDCDNMDEKGRCKGHKVVK